MTSMHRDEKRLRQSVAKSLGIDEEAVSRLNLGTLQKMSFRNAPAQQLSSSSFSQGKAQPSPAAAQRSGSSVVEQTLTDNRHSSAREPLATAPSMHSPSLGSLPHPAPPPATMDSSLSMMNASVSRPHQAQPSQPPPNAPPEMMIPRLSVFGEGGGGPALAVAQYHPPRTPSPMLGQSSTSIAFGAAAGGGGGAHPSLGPRSRSTSLLPGHDAAQQRQRMSLTAAGRNISPTSIRALTSLPRRHSVLLSMVPQETWRRLSAMDGAAAGGGGSGAAMMESGGEDIPQYGSLSLPPTDGDDGNVSPQQQQELQQQQQRRKSSQVSSWMPFTQSQLISSEKQQQQQQPARASEDDDVFLDPDDDTTASTVGKLHSAVLEEALLNVTGDSFHNDHTNRGLDNSTSCATNAAPPQQHQPQQQPVASFWRQTEKPHTTATRPTDPMSPSGTRAPSSRVHLMTLSEEESHLEAAAAQSPGSPLVALTVTEPSMAVFPRSASPSPKLPTSRRGVGGTGGVKSFSDVVGLAASTSGHPTMMLNNESFGGTMSLNPGMNTSNTNYPSSSSNHNNNNKEGMMMGHSIRSRGDAHHKAVAARRTRDFARSLMVQLQRQRARDDFNSSVVATEEEKKFSDELRTSFWRCAMLQYLFAANIAEACSSNRGLRRLIVAITPCISRYVRKIRRAKLLNRLTQQYRPPSIRDLLQSNSILSKWSADVLSEFRLLLKPIMFAKGSCVTYAGDLCQHSPFLFVSHGVLHEMPNAKERQMLTSVFGNSFRRGGGGDEEILGQSLTSPSNAPRGPMFGNNVPPTISPRSTMNASFLQQPQHLSQQQQRKWGEAGGGGGGGNYLSAPAASDALILSGYESSQGTLLSTGAMLTLSTRGPIRYGASIVRMTYPFLFDESWADAAVQFAGPTLMAQRESFLVSRPANGRSPSPPPPPGDAPSQQSPQEPHGNGARLRLELYTTAKGGAPLSGAAAPTVVTATDLRDRLVGMTPEAADLYRNLQIFSVGATVGEQELVMSRDAQRTVRCWTDVVAYTVPYKVLEEFFFKRMSASIRSDSIAKAKAATKLNMVNRGRPTVEDLRDAHPCFSLFPVPALQQLQLMLQPQAVRAGEALVGDVFTSTRVFFLTLGRLSLISTDAPHLHDKNTQHPAGTGRSGTNRPAPPSSSSSSSACGAGVLDESHRDPTNNKPPTTQSSPPHSAHLNSNAAHNNNHPKRANQGTAPTATTVGPSTDRSLPLNRSEGGTIRGQVTPIGVIGLQSLLQYELPESTNVQWTGQATTYAELWMVNTVDLLKLLQQHRLVRSAVQLATQMVQQKYQPSRESKTTVSPHARSGGSSHHQGANFNNKNLLQEKARQAKKKADWTFPSQLLTAAGPPSSLLRAHALFDHIPDRLLQRVCRALRVRVLAPGEPLFIERTTPREAIVLLVGVVQVTQSDGAQQLATYLATGAKQRGSVMKPPSPPSPPPVADAARSENMKVLKELNAGALIGFAELLAESFMHSSVSAVTSVIVCAITRPEVLDALSSGGRDYSSMYTCIERAEAMVGRHGGHEEERRLAQQSGNANNMKDVLAAQESAKERVRRYQEAQAEKMATQALLEAEEKEKKLPACTRDRREAAEFILESERRLQIENRVFASIRNQLGAHVLDPETRTRNEYYGDPMAALEAVTCVNEDEEARKKHQAKVREKNERAFLLNGGTLSAGTTLSAVVQQSAPTERTETTPQLTAATSKDPSQATTSKKREPERQQTNRTSRSAAPAVPQSVLSIDESGQLIVVRRRDETGASSSLKGTEQTRQPPPEQPLAKSGKAHQGSASSRAELLVMEQTSEQQQPHPATKRDKKQAQKQSGLVPGQTLLLDTIALGQGRRDRALEGGAMPPQPVLSSARGRELQHPSYVVSVHDTVDVQHRCGDLVSLYFPGIPEPKRHPVAHQISPPHCDSALLGTATSDRPGGDHSTAHPSAHTATTTSSTLPQQQQQQQQSNNNNNTATLGDRPKRQPPGRRDEIEALHAWSLSPMSQQAAPHSDQEEEDEQDGNQYSGHHLNNLAEPLSPKPGVEQLTFWSAGGGGDAAAVVGVDTAGERHLHTRGSSRDGTGVGGGLRQAAKPILRSSLRSDEAEYPYPSRTDGGGGELTSSVLPGMMGPGSVHVLRVDGADEDPMRLGKRGPAEVRKTAGAYVISGLYNHTSATELATEAERFDFSPRPAMQPFAPQPPVQPAPLDGQRGRMVGVSSLRPVLQAMGGHPTPNHGGLELEVPRALVAPHAPSSPHQATAAHHHFHHPSAHTAGEHHSSIVVSPTSTRRSLMAKESRQIVDALLADEPDQRWKRHLSKKLFQEAELLRLHDAPVPISVGTGGGGGHTTTSAQQQQQEPRKGALVLPMTSTVQYVTQPFKQQQPQQRRDPALVGASQKVGRVLPRKAVVTSTNEVGDRVRHLQAYGTTSPSVFGGGET